MKWMPFTRSCHQQLIKEGYTHILVKKAIKATQLWLNNRKDLLLLEASRNSSNNPPQDGEPITSNKILDLFNRDNTDYYVMVG